MFIHWCTISINLFGTIILNIHNKLCEKQSYNNITKYNKLICEIFYSLNSRNVIQMISSPRLNKKQTNDYSNT